MITEILPNDCLSVVYGKRRFEGFNLEVAEQEAGQEADEKPYPRCDIRQTNITLKVMPGTVRNVEFLVPELDHVWGKPIAKSFC